MNGLSGFGFLVILLVTIAQIAGNNKREKKKFEDKNNNLNSTKTINKPVESNKKKGPKQLNEGKVSEDAPVPSFEADNSYVAPEEISDRNNPFEAD